MLKWETGEEEVQQRATTAALGVSPLDTAGVELRRVRSDSRPGVGATPPSAPAPLLWGTSDAPEKVQRVKPEENEVQPQLFFFFFFFG